MPKKNEIKRNTPDFVIYETDDNMAKVSVHLEDRKNKTDEKVFMLLPKDLKKYSGLALDDVFVITA